MNSRVAHTLCMVVLLILTGSCIKDDLSDCPPQYQVQVSVKDKNYFNINEFPELSRLDENLPFRTYTGTIYYALRDAVTNALVKESTVDVVNGNDQKHSIVFDNIPYGDYFLTVWGNLTTEYPAGVLHQDGKEHTDIYVATRKLSFTDGAQAAELFLERAKGKLLLLCTNFPPTVTQIGQKVDKVYQYVDENFNYSGNASVSKNVPFQSTLETFMAPTVAGGSSKLNLTFYTNGTRAEAAPMLVLPEMDITFRRNEISAVRVDYNTLDHKWDISLFINGEWTMIHRLDIQQ